MGSAIGGAGKISARRSFETVRPLTEITVVQVALEERLLCHELLEAEREAPLAFSLSVARDLQTFASC